MKFCLYIVTGSEFVESAPLKPCANMVMKSRRERREREEAERQKLQETGTKDQSDSDEDDNEAIRANVAKTRQMLERKNLA